MYAVAVDYGIAINADLVLIKLDLCHQSSPGTGDFDDRYQGSNIEHFCSGEDQYGTTLPAYLR
ncbi:MAG: hypothetical protein WBF71_13775 [Microthrixaceae bacterium]